MWTKKQGFPSRISTNSGVNTKKKERVFISKKCTNFHDFWGGEPRKKGLYCKICETLTNSGGPTSISSQASNCTPVASRLLLSLEHNSRLVSTILVWEGTAPECFPRGARPGKVLFLIFTIRQKKRLYTKLKLDERKPRKQDTQLKSLPEVVKTSPFLSPSQPTFCCQGPTHARRLRRYFGALPT